MKYTIILAAKEKNDIQSYNNQMQPIRGKPAIDWVIKNHLNDNLMIVLNDDNIQAKKYINKNYPKIKIIEIKNTNTILESLFVGLSQLPNNIDLLNIVLGDSLCYNIPNNKNNFVLSFSNILTSDRWCLVTNDKNKILKNIYDKIKNISLKDKKALVGFYQFNNINLLKECLKQSLENNEKQISSVLEKYNKKEKIYIEEIETWYDFGHKDGIIKAKNNLFNSRNFNSLEVNSLLGIITKISTKVEKLKDEYNWYINLPEKLKILTPRIINFYNIDNKAKLEMEMYGYSPLSELFILGELGLEEWNLILKHLFKIHSLLEEYSTNDINKEQLQNIYYKKTFDRLNDLFKQNVYWKVLWNYNVLNINNKKYKNINYFINKIKQKINHLIDTPKISIVHGDFCFSNILFDVNCFICKLIDPRGRLQKQTIYGDAKYDIAKLRHSVVGGYDFIVHGLFSLKENKNNFLLNINKLEFQEKLNELFDNLLISYDYDLKEIKFIEALLFLTMIPLHQDDFERQKVFYLNSVIKFNEVFND